jgi:hypothetical protein
MGLEPGDTIWIGKAAGDSEAKLGDRIGAKAATLGELLNTVDTRQPPN